MAINWRFKQCQSTFSTFWKIVSQFNEIQNSNVVAGFYRHADLTQGNSVIAPPSKMLLAAAAVAAAGGIFVVHINNKRDKIKFQPKWRRETTD